MTERLRTNPFTTYHQGEPRRASVSGGDGLSTKKTMLVLVVVVGCFAVLWPKLFYPMLVNNANSQMKPGPVDKTTGCCDVISELDLDTIKIMSELCSTIIDTTGETPPSPKEIVIQCRKAVLETCGIDISAALQDRIVSLGHSVKQILEEVRSLNGSLCLKYNFGLSPWRLGVPHRVNINLDPLNSIKQERPTHMRSEMIHPAFKERGRAIPQPDPSGLPRRTAPAPRIVEGRPGPIPGMRPAMGGPGHMVPPPKQSNYGFMGVLMPIYTVGFVVFFTYTVMKLVFKKKTEAHVGAPLYPPCESDERFHKEVFEPSKNYFHRPSRDNSKIGDEELDQLRKRLRETELAMERIVEQMAQAPLVTQDEIKANGSLPKEDEQGTVKVMGMETTASCEGGKKWSRPDSPVLPHPHPVAPKEPSPPPQQIFLERSLPPQSQILVADSATEAQKDSEDDSPVVLAGKMTLSVISLDSETGAEDPSTVFGRAEALEEERRTSSSNASEEFEKINAADLEDQINSIIEEAENLALTEENRYSLTEELDKYTEEALKAPQINDKDKDNDVLEEIKNQLNLEDDLLLALKEKEPEGKIGLPVTDIIKEFLDNEENALLVESKEIKVDDLREEGIDILERKIRSLSEDRGSQEFKLNEDLAGNVIKNVKNKEVESSAFSKKKDFEPDDLLVEQAPDEDLNYDELDEAQNVDTDIGDNNKLLPSESKKAVSWGNDESKVFDKVDSEEKKQNVSTELSQKTEEKVNLDNTKANVSKKEDSILALDNLGTENKLISELIQGTEEAISLENDEIKVSEEESYLRNSKLDLDIDNKVFSELSQQTQEAVSSENEKSKVHEKGIDSEKVEPDIVPEYEVINALSQNSEEKTASVRNEQLKISAELPIDFEKIQQNLVFESEVNLEDTELKLKKEIIPEEKSLLAQKVTNLESSKEYYKVLVSEHDKHEEKDNKRKERTSEESNGNNKADLLLQGLIVKENAEAEDKKVINIPSTEEDMPLVQGTDQPTVEKVQEIRNEETKEELGEKNVSTENVHSEECSIDEEGLIDDEDYDDSEDELVDEEVRDINRDIYEDRRESMERRVNGEGTTDTSRNGAVNSETAAENEISDEDLENEDEDDEEIEEIIEYVDNTDDEGEEIVEINGNVHHLTENGEN